MVFLEFHLASASSADDYTGGSGRINYVRFSDSEFDHAVVTRHLSFLQRGNSAALLGIGRVASRFVPACTIDAVGGAHRVLFEGCAT